MKKLLATSLTLAGLATVTIAAKVHSSQFEPGARTLVLAHNAYPDEGKYGDRLDQRASAGLEL